MRPTERHSLHFDFAHLEDVLYTFRCARTSLALHRHEAQTLAAARQRNPLLRLFPDDRLTHYVDADLPSDAIALMVVTKQRSLDGRTFDVPVHLGIHIPRAGRDAARVQRRPMPGAIHPKLSRHGITPEQFTAVMGDDADPQFPQHIASLQDATDAATALLFQHANLINLSTENGGAVPAYIVDNCITPALSLATLPDVIYQQGDAWLQTTPIDGTTSVVPCQQVQATITAPLQQAVQSCQADPSLAGQQWNYEYSTTSSSYDASSGGTVAMAEVRATPGENWTPRILSPTNGLEIETGSVSYTPPSTGDQWLAEGIWSINDSTAPLTQAIVTQLLDGSVSVTITTPSFPQGLLSATLIPGTPDPGTGLMPFTADFTGASGTATGTFQLNSGHTGLTYSLSASGLGDNAGAQFVAQAATLSEIAITNVTGLGSISLTCKNNWLRHLSVYVQYLDSDGNVLTPQTWPEKLPGFLQGTFEPDATKKFAALVSPVITVFGVPLPADPTTITVPIWEDVSTVRFLWGGLGRGSYDGAVCPIGIVVTALAEIVLPVFLLAAGSGVTNSAPVKALMADKEVLFAVCAAGAFLVAGPAAAYIALSQDPKEAVKHLLATFGPMLLSPATSLGRWVVAQIAAGVAEDAVPFIDIALAVFRGAVTAAELSQTTIEVVDSPFVYETDLVASINLSVQLDPDPRYNKFPDYHDHYRVSVVYDSGATVPVYEQSLPVTTISDPITVCFTQVPAGGQLRVLAFFYASNGWVSGHGKSGWLEAVGDVNGNLTVELTIKTNIIPLTQTSVYVCQQTIGQLNDGTLGWLAAVGTPPTETVTSQGAITSWNGITVAQEPEMAGYCWEATGLDVPMNSTDGPPSDTEMYTVQNLSLLQDPQDGYAVPPVGFSSESGIAYDIASPDDGTGSNFFIDPTNGEFDPTNPAGGYQLRKAALSSNGPPLVLAVQTNSSWGRFPSAMDRYVVHPQGYVFAINFGTSKIYRLRVPAAPQPDASAPMATLASGLGERDGLVDGPAGLAIALDGRLLVLESGNQRVQAFDICGKPVPYFANPDYDPNDPSSPKTICTMSLNSGSATYLDLSVESQGYIYVLYYVDDGSDPSDYFVDIYQPDGTFLVQTQNVAAANIDVDILRNLYTLNYEQIVDQSGRPQPSISMWLPPAPPPPSEGS